MDIESHEHKVQAPAPEVICNIALLIKVAPSQFGTWSPLLWLMLTTFDSTESITPFVSLAALS